MIYLQKMEFKDEIPESGALRNSWCKKERGESFLKNRLKGCFSPTVWNNLQKRV